MPDNRHVGIAVAGAHPLVIFAESIVQHPVQVVLDAPMRPHDLPQAFRVESIHAADEVTALRFGDALEKPRCQRDFIFTRIDPVQRKMATVLG